MTFTRVPRAGQEAAMETSALYTGDPVLVWVLGSQFHTLAVPTLPHPRRFPAFPALSSKGCRLPSAWKRPWIPRFDFQMSKGLINWLLSEDKTLKLKHHLSPGVYGCLSPLNTPASAYTVAHLTGTLTHTHSHVPSIPGSSSTWPEGTFQSNNWLLSEEGDRGWGVHWGTCSRN